MSYYRVKNLKIDKKNNKIGGMISDSSLRDWKDRLVWDECNDLYPGFSNVNDKIALLYYDIICGNIHPISNKLSEYTCTWDYFKSFIDDYKQVRYNEDRKELELYNVYLKHKHEFDDYIKKDCVLKSKSYYNMYISRENKCSYSLNRFEKAKKFNSDVVKNNTYLMDKYEIVYI